MQEEYLANSNDATGWMWIQACELLEQADRLHRQFFQLSAAQHEASWEPPVDVFEDEREVVVVVAMPGVTAERVQVISEPGSLVVRGLRPIPLTGPRQRVRQLEIPYGAFERRIPLPQGRVEIGPPELIQGCLFLRLRKI
jgi:HSP20 family molecular chaperone IbpA